MSYRTMMLEDAPLHYWSMDDDTSTMQAVVGNPGIHVNVPTLRQAGALNTINDQSANYAVKYPQGGTAQYSYATVDLSAYTAIHVEFWLYWPSYANDNALCMESGPDYLASNGLLFDPNHSSGNWVYAFGRTSGHLWAYSIGRPSAGAWHHFLISLNRGTGASEAFVDGASVTVTVIQSDIIGYNEFGYSIGAIPISLMARQGGGLYTCVANSLIDEVAIYNTATFGTNGRRTSAQAALAHYNEGITGSPTSKFNNYQFVRAGNGISVTERIR